MLTVAALTDVGLCMEINEDALSVFAVGSPAPPVVSGGAAVSLSSPAVVLGVYDGTGDWGLSPGHIAARIVSERLAAVPAPPAVAERAGLLLAALSAAGDAIFAAHHGRGAIVVTTATLALVVSDHVSIANVGDSRAYLFRAGALTQLTRDDTLVADLVESGQLAPAEVETCIHRTVITRALGFARDVEVRITAHTLQPDDVLLLCTGGLWRLVGDDALAAILARPERPEALCRVLVEAANRAGGHDNVTVVVAVCAG